MFPVAGRGRSQPPCSQSALLRAEDMLACAKGTKKPLRAAFAALRVPYRRRAAATHRRRHATYARRGSLAHWRAPCLRRTKDYLSNLPADADLKPLPQQSRRVGSANRRISNLRKNSAGPLRRAILAWSASSCADDDDCLRLAQSRSFTETKGGKRIAAGPPQPSSPAIRRAVLAHLSRAPPYI